MGFIRDDINLPMLRIIGLVLIFIVILTLFYFWNFKSINEDYDQKTAELNKTFYQLIEQNKVLNKTKQDLSLKEEREDQLSEQYNTVREQKETFEEEATRLRAENTELTDELDEKRSLVTQLNRSLTQVELRLQSTIDELHTVETQVSALQNRVSCYSNAAPGAGC